MKMATIVYYWALCMRFDEMDLFGRLRCMTIYLGRYHPTKEHSVGNSQLDTLYILKTRDDWT